MKQYFTTKTIREGVGDDINGIDPCFWWRRGRVELPVQKIPWLNVLQAYSAFCSRASKLLLTKSQRAQPIYLTLPISVSGQRHPGFMTPASPPPGVVRADAAALFRRLERKLCRCCCQLLFCHLFIEMGGTSACNSPEYSPVEPARPLMVTTILSHNISLTSTGYVIQGNRILTHFSGQRTWLSPPMSFRTYSSEVRNLNLKAARPDLLINPHFAGEG